MSVHGKHYAFAAVTEAEYDVIKALAKKDQLSISNFVRRCINGYILECGDAVPLLDEFVPRGPKAREPSVRGPGRPRKSIRVHAIGCSKALSVPVDQCPCGGRDLH